MCGGVLFIYFISKASTKVALTLLGLQGRSCWAAPDHPSSLSPRVCPEEPRRNLPSVSTPKRLILKPPFKRDPDWLHSLRHLTGLPRRTRVAPAPPQRPPSPARRPRAAPRMTGGSCEGPAPRPAVRCRSPSARPALQGGPGAPPSPASSRAPDAGPHCPCSVGVGTRWVQSRGLGHNRTRRHWPCSHSGNVPRRSGSFSNCWPARLMGNWWRMPACPSL